jgi:hypothetical protein
LAKVENVLDARGSRIRRSEPPQPKRIFDEAQDASERKDGVRNFM